MTQNEIWKDVPGYEGKYQASSLGRIRSLPYVVNSYRKGTPKAKRVKPGKIIKISIHRTGYGFISLCNGFTKNFLAHRIVAMAFLPNPENKPCVNHKNGIKTDNRIENLEWCTYSENERHSYAVLGKKPNQNIFLKGKIPHNIKKVLQYNLSGELIAMFESATAAAKKLGTSQGRISCNCRGETMTCRGFKFEYSA